VEKCRDKLRERSGQVHRQPRRDHWQLTQQTGRNFGFDLAAWHHFLLSDDKLSPQHTFDYA
jgi:hypothetical protein